MVLLRIGLPFSSMDTTDFVLSDILSGTGFSLDRAVVLALACDLAYLRKRDGRVEKPEEVIFCQDQISTALGIAKVTTFDEGNTQGYWFSNEKVALLAFRGTQNAEHWRTDFRILPPERNNHSWGMVHPGFLRSFDGINSVMESFAATCRELEYVWVTGHSLGGALAVLAAAWLREKSIKSSVYTYGQPMVGFENFTQRFDLDFDGHLFRFINQSDIVPRMPGTGYRHCGSVKRIVQPLVLQALGGGSETPVFTDEEEPSLTREEVEDFLSELSDDDLGPATQGMMLGWVPWFAHHSIARYVALLEEIRVTERTASHG